MFKRFKGMPMDSHTTHSLDSMLLVVPVPFQAKDGNLLVETQAFNGLERWADNFEHLVVAAPVLEPQQMAHRPELQEWKDIAELPCRDRVDVVLLPYAYHPVRFVRAYQSTRRVLARLIAQCRYLQFAIGGLFGDWAAVAALEAQRQRRPYALHADRVEDEVMRRTTTQLGWKRKVWVKMTAAAMKYYHRWVVSRSALGLWNGQECYAAYAPFCHNSHVIHDLHTQPEDVITEEEIENKVGRCLGETDLRICYTGRANEMKAPLEWVRALGRARDQGAAFRATWLGDGPLLGEMRELIANAGLVGRVSLPGFVTDRSHVLESLRSAHLMLFTHVTPESPRCLLESLLSGTPIVGYGSAYPEHLVANFGGGRFVPVHHWEQLGDLLVELSRDRQSLSNLTRQAALSGNRFSDTTVFAERSRLIKMYLRGCPG
jgi:glycosyltransferase involved in cell wall biosynthesis